MPIPETPYLISIFHNRDLYEFRCLGTKVRSITFYRADNNFIDHLRWSDLSDEVQEKAISDIRKYLNLNDNAT